MLLTILSALPYFAMGILMSTMGYGLLNWQLWAVLAILCVSDTISFIRANSW